MQKKFGTTQRKAEIPRGFRLFGLCVLISLSIGACSLTATRPTQEMSDTDSALRAAKEVQADTLAPELYRQAVEWMGKGQREYRLKNFKYARLYLLKAKKYAEQAEFEAIRNGARRQSLVAPPPPPPPPSPTFPSANESEPEGVWAEEYERQLQEKKQQEQQPSSPPEQTPPTPPPGTLPNANSFTPQPEGVGDTPEPPPWQP